MMTNGSLPVNLHGYDTFRVDLAKGNPKEATPVKCIPTADW